jgi:hypothetical protein
MMSSLTIESPSVDRAESALAKALVQAPIMLRQFPHTPVYQSPISRKGGATGSVLPDRRTDAVL